MKALLVGTVLLASVVDVAAQGKPDTRVALYVFTATDPSGFVDADTTARAKTVTGIVKQLTKSKYVRVVETQDRAVLVLEVTRTAQVDEADSLGALSNTLNALAGGLQALRPRVDEKQTIAYRYATLTKDAYTTELSGHAFPFGVGLAKAIDAWAKTNQAQLASTIQPVP